MQTYIRDVQRDSSATNFIRISTTSTSFDRGNGNENKLPEYPTGTTGVYPYIANNSYLDYHEQSLSDDYIAYLETNLKSNTEESNLVVGISYARDTALNMITKNGNAYSVVGTSDWSEILDNTDYISSQYDTLAGSGLPSAYNEVVLVVDKYNRISTDVLDAIGISYTENLDEISYTSLLNKEFKLIFNDDFYVASQNGDYLQYSNISSNPARLQEAYENKGITLKIVAVIREKQSAASTWISTGIGYTQALTEYVIENNKASEIVEYQKAHTDYNVLTGKPFGAGKSTYNNNLKLLGAVATPTTITIYPKDFDSKNKIVSILDKWNESEIYMLYGNDKDGDGKYIADQNKVTYTDVSELVSGMLGGMIDIITKTLVAFSVISLVVSSIMIAIITYASVIERIKEIGTIRSLGGRKRDVSFVFVAEACIIGAVSAVIALVFTLVINGVINLILGYAVGIKTIARLNILTAIEMIALAIGLNLIASLIPARIAAKKDPVVALRTE